MNVILFNVVCVHVYSFMSNSDPMDYSSPCSSIHGIFQARILVWLPFPTPGDLPHTGIEPVSPVAGDSLPLSHMGNPCLM